MNLRPLALLLTGSMFPLPAIAAPVIFGSHYEDFGEDDCFGSCQIYMAPIPPGKVLIVSNVACSMIAGGPIVGMDIAVLSGPTSGLLRSAPLEAGPQMLVDSAYYSSLNQAANFSIGGGRYPRVQFGTFSTAASWLKCQISGVLYPNPGPGPTPGELN